MICTDFLFQLQVLAEVAHDICFRGVLIGSSVAVLNADLKTQIQAATLGGSPGAGPKTMSKKWNPSLLEAQWKIVDDWKLLYYTVSSQSSNGDTRRIKKTRLGQVTEISHTTKGIVAGQKGCPLVLMKTDRQSERDLPFALQPGLLDMDALPPQMSSALSGRSPLSDIQIARTFTCSF